MEMERPPHFNLEDRQAASTSTPTTESVSKVSAEDSTLSSPRFFSTTSTVEDAETERQFAKLMRDRSVPPAGAAERKEDEEESHRSFRFIPSLLPRPRRPRPVRPRRATGRPAAGLALGPEAEAECAELEEAATQLARGLALQAREESLLPDASLAALEEQAMETYRRSQGVAEHVEAETPAEVVLLTYEDFRALRDELPGPMKVLLRAREFLRLPRDSKGRVSSQEVFRRIHNTTCSMRTRTQLKYYDAEGKGYLREQDLENYLYDFIDNIPSLASMIDSFLPFYVYTAVRRFVFFLDPRRTGRISVAKLANSAVMEEFYEIVSLDGEDEVEGAARNWFSLENTLRVYNSYLELDVDQNGMLSKSEFSKYGMRNLVHLTPAFVDALFEEALTYRTGDASSGKSEHEMDYKTFLDFVLAFENRRSPQSIAFLFRVLDFRRNGHLSDFELCYFIHDLLELLASKGQVVPEREDVLQEIFDMVGPESPGLLTLKDLLRCRVGHLVLSILIDVQGFILYDNRESLAGGLEDGIGDERGPDRYDPL